MECASRTLLTALLLGDALCYQVRQRLGSYREPCGDRFIAPVPLRETRLSRVTVICYVLHVANVFAEFAATRA
jgi:hypothetical protein